MPIRLPLRDNANYYSLLTEYSSAIKIIRVLCIFTMAYSHLYLFKDDSLNAVPYQVAQNLLVDVLARSSVPLLSVVSGFLMAGFFQRKSFILGLQSRFSTIMLPFITWNLIGIMAWGLMNDFSGIHFLNGVLAISDHSFYTHLTFLRDLFVISLFTPLLISGIKRFNIIVPLIVLLIAMFFELAPFIFRSQILIYFVLGLCIALFRINLNIRSKAFTIPVSIIFFSLLLIAALQPFFEESLASLDTNLTDNVIRRPICTIFFFYLALTIVSQKKFSRIFYNLEPAIYLMFLSHSLIGQIIATLYYRAPALHSEPVYLITWLLMPPVCLLCAVLGTRILKQLPNYLSIPFEGRAH